MAQVRKLGNEIFIKDRIRLPLPPSLLFGSPGRSEAEAPGLNASTLWLVPRRPVDTGLQVTPALAFGPHPPSGGGGGGKRKGWRDFRPGGWSENPWEQGQGRTPSPAVLSLLVQGDREFPPFTERGLLAWARPLSLGQVCFGHRGFCPERLGNPLRSPSHPAEAESTWDS